MKKDCRFRDKDCNCCGKIGHLAVVCREAVPAPKPVAVAAKADPKTNGPKAPSDPAKTCVVTDTDKPWVCIKCYAIVNDQSLQKCPKGTCNAKRVQMDKGPAPPKALIPKEALKIIEGEDGEEDPEKAKKRRA